MTHSELTLQHFDAFFAQLNNGHQPFVWQKQVVQHVMDTGNWPDRIAAPTGSGKSSVVDIHVFLVAWSVLTGATAVPRRLVTVVNRRGLVDNQAERARYIADQLRQAREEDTVLGTVARALDGLFTSEHETPIALGHLRGQLPRINEAISEPAACAIIASTPEMWGSRALFRGYGSTRYARPREAAIVTMDCVMVLDEAHLNRQLLLTARRITQLQKQEQNLGIPRLQVVETTATPQESEGVEITVGEDSALNQRLQANKPLELIREPKWNGKPGNKAVCKTLIAAVQEQLSDKRPGSVGCVVNHVATAIEVAEQLRKHASVALVVGRMRGYDLAQLKQEHPHLFDTHGDDSIDVVVATQTIEVGVDIDLAALVTELAPGSSLAQRFGRVNRLGKRDESPITVVVPADELKRDCPPYKADDVNEALQWISSLQGTSVSPACMSENPLPGTSPERLLYQRPEWADIAVWEQTSTQRFSDDDLDLWLRDSLEEEATAGVVIRPLLPLETPAALEVLRNIPPRAEEVFPGSVATVRDYANEADRAFIFRNGELLVADTIRPSDVLILEEGITCARENVLVEPALARVSPQPVPDPDILGYCFLRMPQSRHDDDFSGDASLRPLLVDFAELTPDEATEEYGEGDVLLGPISTEPTRLPTLSWIIIRRRDTDANEEIRQEWTPSHTQVVLDDHNCDVAERATSLAKLCRIQAQWTESLRLAGLYHDVGKADPRFQILLGKKANQPTLAKSDQARTKQQATRAKKRSGLPLGWRHEMASVVSAQAEGLEDLVLRLVGTSHGRGRNLAPLTASELLGSDADPHEMAIAIELFDVGRWDELMEHTARQIGHWSTACLEAVLRAADGQISGEGK